MKAKELIWIKNAQKEFKNLFGHELLIDFPSMNGVQSSPTIAPTTYDRRKNGVFHKRSLNQHRIIDEYYREYLEKYNLTDDDIQDRKGQLLVHRHDETGRNIKLFLRDFCTRVFNENLDLAYASKLINRNRTLFYFYNKPHKEYDQIAST